MLSLVGDCGTLGAAQSSVGCWFNKLWYIPVLDGTHIKNNVAVHVLTEEGGHRGLVNERSS